MLLFGQASNIYSRPAYAYMHSCPMRNSYYVSFHRLRNSLHDQRQTNRNGFVLNASVKHSLDRRDGKEFGLLGNGAFARLVYES